MVVLMKVDITIKSSTLSTTYCDKISFGITEDISTAIDIIARRYHKGCVSAKLSYDSKIFDDRNYRK